MDQLTSTATTGPAAYLVTASSIISSDSLQVKAATRGRNGLALRYSQVYDEASGNLSHVSNERRLRMKKAKQYTQLIDVESGEVIAKATK
jgi:hypothetical protein